MNGRLTAESKDCDNQNLIFRNDMKIQAYTVVVYESQEEVSERSNFKIHMLMLVTKKSSCLFMYFITLCTKCICVVLLCIVNDNFYQIKSFTNQNLHATSFFNTSVNSINNFHSRLVDMSKITSPWHDMFPKYYEHTIKHIGKIEARKDKSISARFIGDVDDNLLQVEQISNTEFIFRGKIKLRDMLYRLQYLAHFNESETDIEEACNITMNILGEDTKFKLVESKWSSNNQRGWQILVKNADDVLPKYENIMESLNTLDSRQLAKAILHALETPLDTQEMFEMTGYPAESAVNNVRMFILLTHIAEAAVPSVPALKQYVSLVKKQDGNTELKPKHGRLPMMDKIVRAKLRKIANGTTCTFSTEFSEKAFPCQVQNGGTQMSREYALKGNETNPLSDIEDESDRRYQTEVETNPSSEIQDLPDPFSDIEGATGSLNDTEELTNSLRRMNVTAAENN